MKSMILLILGLFFVLSATSADAAFVAGKPAISSDSESAAMLFSNLLHMRAVCRILFVHNAGLSDVDMRKVWNNTTMIPIIREYLDNPEEAKQLDFKVASYVDGYIYLVGISADVKVINEAISQDNRVLFKSDGVTPATRGDSIVYMRVR